MFMPSSSTIFILACSISILIFLKSSSAYIADSNEFIDDRLIDLADRSISTTKFPRIGRSLSDSEENPSDDFQFVDQRSVLFPRIGKRAFHNLLWANSRSNPHRMLDSQGRSYLNGYDYHINPIPSKSTLRYRIKRTVSI